jgi:hypothetical protein
MTDEPEVERENDPKKEGEYDRPISVRVEVY